MKDFICCQQVQDKRKVDGINGEYKKKTKKQNEK